MAFVLGMAFGLILSVVAWVGAAGIERLNEEEPWF